MVNFSKTGTSTTYFLGERDCLLFFLFERQTDYTFSICVF